MAEITNIPVFHKPPRKFLWFTFCNHVWKTYWQDLGPDTQVGRDRCARCLKFKEKLRKI